MAKKRVLAITGGQWHPFEACSAIFKEFVEASGRYTVEVTENRDALKRNAIDRFDAVVIYTLDGELSANQEAGLLRFVERGGALLGLHTATAVWQGCPKYVELIGATFIGHGPGFEFPVTLRHGSCWITDRVQNFRISDELYLLKMADPEAVDVLATAQWKHVEQPMLYTKSYGDGRVCYLALGHDERAFRHPTFQKLALRGLDWTLGRKPRKPIKTGCIGYGPSFNIARLHLESMKAAGLEVVAACDLLETRCQAAEAEWPGIKTFTSAARMLRQSDVELVAVATEHDRHARLVIDCLNAGRHAITEKPMCVTVKQADTMIAAAKKNRRMLSVFHNRRWDGDYVTIKNIIAQGLLGDVFQIELTGGGYSHPGYWWRSDKRISGGAFYDWGAHFCDWVLGLVPARVTEVSGHFVHKAVWHDVTNEDHCQATVRFANGCCAVIELSQLAAIAKSCWRILGTKGALLDLGGEKKSFRVVSYRGGSKVEMEIPYLETDWHAYYRNVADHLLLDEPLAVTPESARRVIGLIETAERSSRLGKSLPPAKGCA